MKHVLTSLGNRSYSSSSDAGSSCLWPLPRNLLKYSASMASIGGEYLLVHPNTICLRRPVPHREPAPRQCLWCAASGLRPSHRFSLIPGRALHCAHVHCAHVCTVLAADRCSTGVEPAAQRNGLLVFMHIGLVSLRVPDK